MSEIEVWKSWFTTQWFLATAGKRGERGEITQTVIIIALFAAASIAIAGIIINKFMAKAGSIPTG